MNPRVDWFFDKDTKWQNEYARLREIILDCGLNEELKWGCPCYTFEKNNIVLIHGFKDYCALLFMKGALLKDPRGILIQQTKNVQAARQIRFTTLPEITKLKSVIKKYVYEAIEAEEAGLKVPMKKAAEFEVPAEFQKRLNRSAALKKAFYSLTPGRQRGYLLYFSQAKQAKTREARVEKYAPQILEGRGLED
ncbi:YdeI/OmpD-associated family protein [Pseudochryseolinea flava]|uniref:YdhG-like domain-containing protein n=1 Tax=Pseudochryseolinea flava TaxID=2059302 RepID=A0A364Y7W6_9BACT|nr:DUF1801 domain-containing protein [Pseudochryseolinea flava]RAW02224.1 hypothetical protein DQQ10_06690 [Pseudochryseolinea flava]